MTIVFLAAVRLLIQLVKRKSREIAYLVRKEIKDSEQPYTVYYERLRVIEGLVLCIAGLYFVSKIYTDPVHTFSGTFIWYLILGFLLIAAGLPLCFICSSGCAAVTGKRVIIYRTRCFRRNTLDGVPREEIERACRITAGRMGVVKAFFAFVSALLKGDRDKASEMYDAAFLNGYLEVRTSKASYRIRLGKDQADNALRDIAELCGNDSCSGEKLARKFSPVPAVSCIAVALIAVVIFGLTLTANAKNTVHRQYMDAVYLEDTEAFSQAYVEFEHLAERYSYKDSGFRARYCYARLEMYQGNFAQAADEINSLPDFEDKNELLYHCALSVEQENSAKLAMQIYTQLGGYKDCEERKKLIEDTYNASVKAYESGRYETAAEGFSLLRDYKQTSEYVSLICKEADKLVPPEGNPENLSSREIVVLCRKAQPILEKLSWSEDAKNIKALCDEYLLIYTFD